MTENAHTSFDDNPIEHKPDRRGKAYSETAEINVNSLPMVKEFNTLDELLGFISGVVGRSNFRVTEFKAVVKVEV